MFDQQIMTLDQAEQFRYNILDLTKVWPHAEYPLRPIGKLVLNENPLNYFAEIEQVILAYPLGREISDRHFSIFTYRLLSLRHTSFRTLSLPLTLSSNPAFSPTPIHIVIVSVLTTNSSQWMLLLFLLPTSSVMEPWPLSIKATGLTTRAPSLPCLIKAKRVILTEVFVTLNVNVSMRISFTVLGEIWVKLLNVSCCLNWCGLMLTSDVVDFEQPRTLWQKVWNDDQRKTYISNVSGHFGQVKSNEVKARQRRLSLELLIELPENRCSFFSICLLHCPRRPWQWHCSSNWLEPAYQPPQSQVCCWGPCIQAQHWCSSCQPRLIWWLFVW